MTASQGCATKKCIRLWEPSFLSMPNVDFFLNIFLWNKQCQKPITSSISEQSYSRANLNLFFFYHERVSTKSSRSENILLLTVTILRSSSFRTRSRISTKGDINDVGTLGIISISCNTARRRFLESKNMQTFKARLKILKLLYEYLHLIALCTLLLWNFGFVTQ